MRYNYKYTTPRHGAIQVIQFLCFFIFSIFVDSDKIQLAHRNLVKVQYIIIYI
jgi:hypothetical protein